jgi:hypothetical protein
MRHVYPTREIPHKWAHQTQAEARNPSGNLYFDGPTIYSYGSHFPLARICTRKDGAKLVLHNSGSYSVTTSKHQGRVRCACPDSWDQINVPYPTHSGRHSENVAYLVKLAADLLASAQRSQSLRRVEWKQEDAFKALENASTYLGFFGIRRKAPAIPTAAWFAAEERARRIENPDPASKDKRERASAARKQATYARERLAEITREIGAPDYREMAHRTDWRLFGAFDTSGAYARYSPSMLRLAADQIETSAGASIPAAHAARLWRVVERCRASGVPYQHNGHSEHAGDYRVDSIDADGTLRAGCHVIPYSELRAMARTLGLLEIA